MSKIEFASYVALYYCVTFKRRKMLQRIAWGDNPSKRQIAAFARCDEKSVQELLNDIRNPATFIHSLMTISKRYDEITGWQKSNHYDLSPGFKTAFKWIKEKGYLNSPNRKKFKIIKHAECDQNTSPKMTKTPPPPRDLGKGFKRTFSKQSVWINPLVRDLGIDLVAQEFASRTSEYVVAEAVETFLYHKKARKKMENPSAYFMGICKNKIKGSKNVS